MPNARLRTRANPIAPAQPIDMSDFSGGLDLKTTPTKMAPSRLQRCHGWSADEPGALSVGVGYRAHMNNVGIGPTKGAIRVYLGDEAPFTIAMDGVGQVNRIDDQGVLVHVIPGVFETGRDVYFTHDRDMVIGVDGVNPPRYTVDGFTWHRLGIAAPTLAPSLILRTGGSLIDANTYGFSYAFRNAAGFTSNESPEATILTATPDLIVDVNILEVSADPQVTEIVIYGRDVDAGEATRREIAVIPNVLGFYSVNEDTWELSDEAFTTHDPAPVLSFICWWKGRLWGVLVDEPDTLAFTDLFVNESWPANFFVAIPFPRGDQINAMQPLGDLLPLFGATSITCIIGSTALDFDVRQTLGPRDGALGFRAVCEVNGKVAHAGTSGVFMFDGSTDALLTADLDKAWRDWIRNGAIGDLPQAALAYHGGTKDLRVGIGRVYPTDDPGELILNFTESERRGYPVWVTSAISARGYLAWNGDEPVPENRDRLFAWSHSLANFDLYELNETYTHDGADQTCSFETAEFVVGRVVGRFLEARVEFKSANGTFTLEFIVAGKTSGPIAVDIRGVGAVYGQAIYNQAVYGGNQYRIVPVDLPLATEGYTIRVRGVYVGKRRFRLLGISIPTAAEGAQRGAL